MVGIAAIATINSTLLVGARTTYAAARDVPQLRSFGDWDDRHGVPRKALLAEGAVALLLVLFGSFTQSGFNTMVEYLTPVYWLFLSLSSVALIILRRRFPEVPQAGARCRCIRCCRCCFSGCACTCCIPA